MDQDSTLWEARSLTITPSGHGTDYRADVQGPDGAALATVEGGGTVRDTSGAVVLEAPVDWERSGKRFSIGLTAGDGRTLGRAHVVKSSVGPRGAKATVEVRNGDGEAVVRAEPDKKGEQVSVAAGDRQVASIAITSVKTGFMRKSRVYAVDLEEGIPVDVRPAVVGLAVRYDGVLNAVKAAAAD